MKYQFSYATRLLNVPHMRAVQDVGLMIVHPTKGIYIGHDMLGKTPVYQPIKEIPANYPIPVFTDEFGFGFLKGVTFAEADSVHQIQVRCQYQNGKGTTFAELAFDGARENVMQADVKFPDGNYYTYHIMPKKHVPILSGIKSLVQIDLPLFREKPPIMKVL